MTMVSRVLWALDNEIGDDSFERLCTALMYRAGFRRIHPVGGTHDEGRDAEEILREGHDEEGRRTFFQYSLEKKWEPKLRKELSKVKRLRHEIEVFVFTTTSAVTARKLKSLHSEVRQRFGWILHIFSREFLRHNLEEVHRDLAEQYLRIKDTTAVRRIRTAIQLPDPEAPELRIAQVLFDSGQYEAAILKIKEAMAVTNRPELCWVMIANAEYALMNYSRALQAAEKALAIDSELYEALFIKGCIMVEDGIASRARSMIVHGRQLFKNLTDTSKGKNDPALAYNLGNAFSAAQEYRQAITQYRRCLRYNNFNAQAWKNLGSCYHELGEHVEELRCLEHALTIDPELPEALFSKGQTLGVVYDRYADGLALLERAIEVDHEFPRRVPRTYWWLAKFRLELGRDDEALRSIDEGLRIAAGDQSLLDLKAVVLAKVWRGHTRYIASAREFFQFRVDVNKNDFASLVELVEIERDNGAESTAKKYAIDALNLLSSPTHPRSSHSFSLAWEEWRRLMNSIEIYTKFRRMRTIDREHFPGNWSGLICDELWLQLGVTFDDLHNYVANLRPSKKQPTIRALIGAMKLSREGVKTAIVASVDSVSRHAIEYSVADKISLVTTLISGSSSLLSKARQISATYFRTLEFRRRGPIEH
jgi:tetratricopeptide (TPR) repeat protein